MSFVLSVSGTLAVLGAVMVLALVLVSGFTVGPVINDGLLAMR
jgi:hypothetical protein